MKPAPAKNASMPRPVPVTGVVARAFRLAAPIEGGAYGCAVDLPDGRTVFAAATPIGFALGWTVEVAPHDASGWRVVAWELPAKTEDWLAALLRADPRCRERAAEHQTNPVEA